MSEELLQMLDDLHADPFSFLSGENSVRTGFRLKYPR